MKPFSPVYFIRENKTRCILLMFMLFLGYVAYLGGIYASNVNDNWQLALDYYDEFVLVYPSNEDEDFSEFSAFMEELEEMEQADILQLGSYNSFNWETIMSFESGSFSFTFLSVEDFKNYCGHMNINCDFDNLESGSLIMSRRFAKNRGLKLGDTVDTDFSETIYSKYTLDAVTDEDGYSLYFINEDSVFANNILILGNGIGGRALYDIVYDLQKKYDVQIYDSFRTDLEGQFASFYTIYYFIIVLMAIILAVTINAAFVGMYQRRNFEFAVYRAIGIPRRHIVGKIVGELLCMDVIALFVGGALFFFGLYLFNNLVLYPIGKYLRYFHPMALTGLFLCNLAVIIPLIITRCRQLLKADICEY